MSEIQVPKIILLNDHCTGRRGADACKHAHRAGASVHMILEWSQDTESLIMPSWHFKDVAAGTAALTHAYKTAVTISTDEELYAARAAKIPHKLPVGWIDPSRR